MGHLTFGISSLYWKHEWTAQLWRAIIRATTPFRLKRGSMTVMGVAGFAGSGKSLLGKYADQG
jgi:hypothetical protein